MPRHLDCFEIHINHTFTIWKAFSVVDQERSSCIAFYRQENIWLLWKTRNKYYAPVSGRTTRISVIWTMLPFASGIRNRNYISLNEYVESRFSASIKGLAQTLLRWILKTLQPVVANGRLCKWILNSTQVKVQFITDGLQKVCNINESMEKQLLMPKLPISNAWIDIK